jgi:hypothetical protein
VLKCDFEVSVPGAQGNFFYFCFPDIADKGFFDISNTVIYVVSRALSNHLNIAIAAIADYAGQPVAIGRVERGKSKADTLDSASENYPFGDFVHRNFHIKQKCISVQAGNSEIN